MQQHALSSPGDAGLGVAEWSRLRFPAPPHGPGSLLDAALAPTDEALHVFGGRRADGALSAELWRLHLATGTWTLHRSGDEERPAARSGHTLVALRGALWLLGGRGDAGQVHGGMWRFDVSAPRWALLAETPDALARTDHCAAAHHRLGTMLVHGGGGRSGLRDDLWSWDQLTARWEHLDGEHAQGPAGGVRPAARRGHTCALVPDTRELLVLGGSGAAGVALHDLWAFDLHGRTWAERAPPPARSAGGVPAAAAAALEPTVAPLVDRLLRAECVGGAADGADDASQPRPPRHGGAARRVAAWQYSGRRRAWERVAAPAAGTRGEHAPPCPRGLVHARAAADARGERLWVLGSVVGATSNNLVGMELWSYRAGADCAAGCVHGVCDPLEARCVCEEGWGGADCSRAVCDPPCAHGTCEGATARCACEPGWHGAGCDERRCLPGCAAPRGVCDANSGSCMCSPPWSGLECEVASCPDCRGRGRCDARTGCCVCELGYTGCDCATPVAGRWEPLEVRGASGAGTARAPSSRGVVPSMRFDAAAAECDGRPTIVGGNAASDWSADGRPLRLSPTSEIWALDPAQGGERWVQLAVDLQPSATGWRGEQGPSARRGAAAAALGSGTIALHGGVMGEERFEVPSDELWTMGCPLAGKARWRHHAPRDTRHPSPRGFHAVAQVPTAPPGTLDVLVYGGRAPLGGAAAFAANAAADAAATAAAKQMARGDADAAAVAAAAAAASRLEATAERGRRRVFGDLWRYDASGVWRLLSGTAAGDAEEPGAADDDGGDDDEAKMPPARQAHAALTHRRGAGCEARGCLLVYGGCDAHDVPLDDLWQYELLGGRWRQIQPALGGAWPAARHHHSLTLVGGAVHGALLFGGVGLRARAGDTPLVDATLWHFDLVGRWTRIQVPAGAPQPDRRIGHAGVGINSSLWLLGGLAVHGASDSADAAAPPTEPSLRVWRFGAAVETPIACPQGCGVHGACDLLRGHCVCDPPWDGADCSLPSRAPAPTAVRRALRVLMCACAAVVGGLALGWLNSAIIGPLRSRAQGKGYQKIGEREL